MESTKNREKILVLCYKKCSTCQKAKKWLDDKGLEFQLRDIKLENPSAEELRTWWKRAGAR